MTRTDTSDDILDTFNRRVIACQNHQSLDEGKKKETGTKDASKPIPPSEDEEAEKPPFTPA